MLTTKKSKVKDETSFSMLQQKRQIKVSGTRKNMNALVEGLLLVERLGPCLPLNTAVSYWGFSSNCCH